eukprot:jgi/Picre1/27664/NNA_000628.t1
MLLARETCACAADSTAFNRYCNDLYIDTPPCFKSPGNGVLCVVGCYDIVLFQSSPSACLSELDASYHTSRLEVFGVSTQPTGGFPRFSSAGRHSSSVWKVDPYSKVALSECSGSRGFAAGRSISTFINPVLEKDEKKESNGEGSQEGAEKEKDAPAPPQSPEEMQAQIEEFKSQLEEKEKS